MTSDTYKHVSLKSICSQVQYGHTAKASETKFGIGFVRGTDINTNYIDWRDVPDCNASDEDLKKYGLTHGDILITRMGTIGTSAVVDNVPRPSVFASYLIRHRVHKELANPFFVGYVLKSQIFDEFISSHGGGAVQPNINAKTLGEFKLPLPPLKEQNSIASFLGRIDERIILLRETNDTLESISKTIFESWFVKFHPVHAKSAGCMPDGMDLFTSELFPDDFYEVDSEIIPKGWKIEVAENWLSVLESGRRPKGGVSGITEGVPSIGAESISKIGDYDYKKTKFVSTDFFESMKSGIAQSHDVLLYKDGGKPGVFLPRVSMFGDDFPFNRYGINEHVFRVRLKPPFCQVFAYHWLWSDAVMHELKHRGGKAAIPGINKKDVKELRILIPSNAVLARFDEITAPLVSKIFANSKQANSLAKLRDTLLPRLISGQLRLPEAEALVAELN